MSGTGQLPELESLRTQLADVARELAERDRTLREQTTQRDRELQDLREQAILLRAIIEGTAAETSDNFLASLVNHLTSTLQVRYAIIGEVTHERPQTIRTIAVSAGGITGANFEYPLAQTPCETALTRPFACFDHHVQQTFPQFTQLRSMGIDSYCGVPIRTKDGTIIGLLAVMDTKRLQHTDWLHSLLAVFATRAGVELQRQRAEQAQREAERRLRFTQFAMDRAVDGVLWADDSGRFIYANDAVCRSLGYSQEELLDLRINDIAPYHDPERFQSRLDTIKQGGAATYESVHRRKDGTEFPVEVSVTYLEHEGNGYTCGIIRDITERTHIERERHQALADLQNIMETVPDIMFTLDTNGNLIRWNSRLTLVTEYEPESLLNKSALAFVPVEEQTQTAAAIQRAFTEGYAELDGHLLTKTGRTIPYHWTGAALKNPEGTIIGISGIGRDASERKQIERERDIQHARLVNAQTLAHVGSWDWDIESGLMAWSDEQYRIFGHEPQALTPTHETFLTALLPDDHDRVLAGLNSALTGHDGCDMEFRIVRPNGEVRTVHCRAEVDRNADGHPVRMSGSTLDVTERKRTESALQQSEAHFRALIEQSSDIITVLALDGTIRFESPSFERLLGYLPEELDGRIAFEFIHEEDLPGVLAAFQTIVQHPGESHGAEFRFRHKDGSWLPFEGVGRAAYDPEGRLCVIANSRNITERKQAEEDRKRLLALLTNIINATPDLVFTKDRDLRTMLCNHAFARALGKTPDELIGRTDIENGWDPDMVHGNSMAGIRGYEADDQLALSGQVVRIPSDPVNVNGRLRIFDTVKVPLHNETGEIMGLLGIARDITERIEMELKLKRSEARLSEAQRIAHIGSWELDLRSNCLHWSSEIYRIFEINEELFDASYEAFLSLVHPDDRLAVDRTYNDSLRMKTPYAIQHRLLMPDGRIKYVQEQGETVYDPCGQPQRSIGTMQDVTERVQAEEARRESDARTHAILASVLDAVISIDEHSHIIGWNPQAETIFGYPAQEALGRRLDDTIIPARYWAAHSHGINRILQHGSDVVVRRRFEFFALHRDGHEFPVEFAISSTRIDGRLAFTAFVRDITERKRAEVALQEKEQHLTAAQSLAHLGSWTWDIQTGANTWSEEQYRIFGYEPGSVHPTYELFARALHEDDRERVSSAVQAAVTSGTPYDLECRIVQPAGEVRYVQCRGEVERDAEGHPLRMAGTVLDITDRKRAEEALRESEERHRSLVELCPSGVFVFCEGRIVFVNSMAVMLLGGTRAEDILSRSAFDLIHPVCHEAVLANLRQVLAGNLIVQHEERIYLKLDGTPIHVQVQAVRMSWNGKPAVQGFFTDITERKRAEEALRISEERYARATAVGKVGVWELDARAGTYHGDENLKALFGYSGNDLSTDPFQWLNLVHPDDQQIAMDTWQRVVEGETDSYNYQLRMVKKDRSIIWTDIRGHAVRDAGGQVTHVFGATVDITERKLAQDALANRERQLRTVLDALPVGVWFTDSVGTVQLANPAGRAIWEGITQIRIEPGFEEGGWWKQVGLLTGPHRWALERALTQGTSALNDILDVTCADGTKKTLRNSAVPVRATDGTVQGAVLVNEDITERITSERERTRMQALLESIVDNIPHMITVKDAITLRFVSVNRSGERLLGRTRSNLVGCSAYDLLPETDADIIYEQDLAVITCRLPIEIPEHRFESRTDGPRLLNTKKFPIFDADGRPAYLMSISEDVTERKQLAEREASRIRRMKKLYELSTTLSADSNLVFEQVVRTIGELFNVKVVCLSEIVGEELFFKAVYADGRVLADAGCCPLAATPCATVENSRETQIFDHVMERFPEASFLRDYQAFAYLGFPALDHDGRVVAVTCLLDDKPHPFTEEEQDLVHIFGQRIAVEIERNRFACEQKRAEDDLRHSHDFIRQIIDTAPNFIFAKDRASRFTLVNKAVANAYGTTVEGLLGKTDADFNGDQETVAICLKKDQEVLNTCHERFIAEETFTDSNGQTRWLQTVKRPILDEQGHATMVLGVSTDITERKQIEEVLRQREQDLRDAIDERERISQDLHDGILQSLYAVGLGLEACKPLMTQRHYKKAVATMSEAIGQLNHIMSEVRNFIAGLESQVLQGSTFPAALQEMVTTLAATHPLRCTISVDETAAGHISTQQALHLLNIVREALSNSLRHAQATKATVTLKPLSRCLRLSIVDNGIGFEPTGMRGVGHGLTNMAARARKVGGRFAIKSVPRHGTRITIDLPQGE